MILIGNIKYKTAKKTLKDPRPLRQRPKRSAATARIPTASPSTTSQRKSAWKSTSSSRTPSSIKSATVFPLKPGPAVAIPGVELYGGSTAGR